LSNILVVKLVDTRAEEDVEEFETFDECQEAKKERNNEIGEKRYACKLEFKPQDWDE
jgi:hypothetical protein